MTTPPETWCVTKVMISGSSYLFRTLVRPDRSEIPFYTYLHFVRLFHKTQEHFIWRRLHIEGESSDRGSCKPLIPPVNLSIRRFGSLLCTFTVQILFLIEGQVVRWVPQPNGTAFCFTRGTFDLTGRYLRRVGHPFTTVRGRFVTRPFPDRVPEVDGPGPRRDRFTFSHN